MKILLKILDYIISVLMGVGTLALVSLVVSQDWNMFLAMIAGMLLGGAVLLSSALFFLSVSTPFELFPVGMVITMITGMAAGMLMSVSDLRFSSLLRDVVVFCFIVQIWIDLYNVKLKGEVPRDNQN